MDRMMPIDLENAKLRRTLRGYDPRQVKDCLEEAARSLESLLAENNTLREDLNVARAENQLLKDRESLVKDAILLAQATADETRAVAHRHAELILEEARRDALAERVGVQQQISELRWDMERLRHERQAYVEEYRALLERQLRELALGNSFAVVETAVEEDSEAIGA